MTAIPPRRPRSDRPALIAARRSAARTGLLAGVVILLLGLALNVWVLVDDLHHHRGIVLPVIGCGAVAVGLLFTALRWRTRMKRSPRPEQPRQ